MRHVLWGCALLAACVRLEEGDYFVDYSPVTVDSCDLYGGGQALDDATGELSWEDGTLVFEFDGTDDDLAFSVDGTAFAREAQGTAYLDDSGACWLATEQADTGEMGSNTTFEGHTAFVGVLQGDCGVFDAMFDDPCNVEFDWRGDREG